MAKVKKNPVIQGISGRIGNLVFKQMRDGSTIVAAKQVLHRKKWSENQLAHQARMREAAAYGRGAQHHPVYVALAEKSPLTAYNFAFGDRMKPPVIHSVERNGNIICVRASDDVMVVKVEVSILDEGGKVRMKGEATQTAEGEWEFVSDMDGKFVVQVWDLAGNVTEG